MLTNLEIDYVKKLFSKMKIKNLLAVPENTQLLCKGKYHCTGLDLIYQVNLQLIKHKQIYWIQTSKTGKVRSALIH